MKINRILVIALLAAVLLASAALAAEMPELSRTGSVTVDILTTDDRSPVSGGTLTLYPVALAENQDGHYRFVLTPAFAACGMDPNVLDSAEQDAETLAAFAQTAQLAGTAVSVNDQGRAVFGDLALGLYLVVQDTPARGYSAIRPFLVTVPLREGDALVYDVYANPKPGTADALPTPVPSPTPTPGPKLPQTGQLWWPVALLAALGVLLVAVGAALRRKS